MKHTPLFQAHVSLGGRMVPFAGWEMPLQYTSILEEARSIRSGVGLFDVSHMGRIRFSGPTAAAFLDRFLSADVLSLPEGRARYNLICNREGGIIDDALVYHLGKDRFLLVPNAGNTRAVLGWLESGYPKRHGVVMEEITQRYAMIAVQGPQALSILKLLSSMSLASMKPFECVEAKVASKEALVSRTGYTGEDGFEVILPSEDAEHLWRLLTDKGARPCGLGARDVLRLEAGLLLHGNDMDTSTNPFEAGLERFVHLDKDDYAAGPALRQLKESGVSRRLVGFRMMDKAIPRHGYAIMDRQDRIGQVTSGGYSPALDMSIGLGYVPIGCSSPGTRIWVDVRGRAVEAEVVPLPFYSRKRRP